MSTERGAIGNDRIAGRSTLVIPKLSFKIINYRVKLDTAYPMVLVACQLIVRVINENSGPVFNVAEFNAYLAVL